MLSAFAQGMDGVMGFATYADLGLQGVTGGGSGDIMYVSSRTEFEAAMGDDTPRTVILTSSIEGYGKLGGNDEVNIGSNKTLLAQTPDVVIDGINIVASSKQNIIIRNITLKNGKPDGLTFKNCHHVWIDHCDLSSGDDGLLDFTLGSSYMTVSYCKIHHHNKVSLCNSGTQHFEDIGRQRVTYHHNYWYDNTQRNPRIGYGLGHVFNNYYERISSYCIGYHSHAKVLSENNYFAKTAKNPLNSMYSSDPTWITYAEARDRGSYVESGSIGTQQGTVFEPSDYYDYTFALDAAAGLKTSVPASTGPIPSLCDEPILFPGNGAINVVSTTRLLCSNIPGATLQGIRIAEGTDPAALAAANLQKAENVNLRPSTRYLWQAVYSKGGVEVLSPVYHFRTASLLATKPYPADGEKHANLREAVAEQAFNGNMKLRWAPSFSAENYKVELWAEGGEKKTFTTTAGSVSDGVDVGFLRHNVDYHWTVTPLGKNGEPLATPAEWTFTSSAATISMGNTSDLNIRLTDFTRNSNAWKQYFGSTVKNYDEEVIKVDSVIIADAGPGCVMAVYDDDKPRRVEFTVTYRNKEATASNSGKSYFALYVNDEQVEWWSGYQAKMEFYNRVLGKHVTLHKGDEVRLEFYTTVQSSNYTQLALLKIAETDDDDFQPENPLPDPSQTTYDDPFAESWWPNVTTFHSPTPASADKDYEIVYLPGYETATKGIYALNDAATAAWVDGRFKINNRTIYSPEKDDMKTTKTQAGIVCGENSTMVDGNKYRGIISMSVENTSLMRCYISGSSSYFDRMQVTVIPVGEEGGQFTIYSTKQILKNQPDCFDIKLDPSQRYRLMFDSEKSNAMFLGAVRLYTASATSLSLPAVEDIGAAPTAAALYNLSGQQVTAGYKGIVISNGIKIHNR